MKSIARAFKTGALQVAAAVVLVALFAPGAFAQEVPPQALQEILIKTSLLTFNDANTTGNYAVFHDRLAKPFRDQYPPEKLAETFKPFRDQHAFLDLIAAKTPIPTEQAKVENGRLTLRGYFDTAPSRTYYDLAFVPSEEEWKLVQITLNFKKPDK
jgi:hypothetical protein